MFCAVCNKEIGGKNLYGQKTTDVSYGHCSGFIYPNKQGTCISISCSKECHEALEEAAQFLNVLNRN